MRGRKKKFSEEEERHILERAQLENVTELAKELGIDRTTIYLMRKRHPPMPSSEDLKLQKTAHALGYGELTQSLKDVLLNLN